MKKSIWLSLTAILLFAIPSFATSVSVQSGGVTIISSDLSSAGTQASPWLINESMTNAGTLQFDGFLAQPTGTGTHESGSWFTKTIINNTGTAWTSFELELQWILGTPSTEGDGLSFAQGAGLTFSSDKFADYSRIDIERDYVNFNQGFVDVGETLTLNFAITDNSPESPFWLLQTPNKVDAPVPEPSTFILFGAGLGGLALWRKRKQS